MEVRKINELLITLSNEEYQKYLNIESDEPSQYFNFKKFLSHIQIVNIIDVLEFNIEKLTDKVVIKLKVVIK